MAHTHAEDPLPGQAVPLFHPRINRWEEHFQWSAANAGFVEGITRCGRATVALLPMNEPLMVDTRRLLTALGLHDNAPTG